MDTPTPRDDAAIMNEVLSGLAMPASGLRAWIEHERRFCDAHGGRRVYGELLAIFDDLERALDREEPA